MQPDMAPEQSRLIIRQFVAPLASRKSKAALVRPIMAAAPPGVGREMYDWTTAPVAVGPERPRSTTEPTLVDSIVTGLPSPSKRSANASSSVSA